MGSSKSKPQVEDSILTSASETDSEAIVAFNFGGSTGVIMILVGALMVMFFMYQFCRCCLPVRCKKHRRTTNNNQDMSNAILSLALAIGQQHQGQQQQVQQQVQERQERQLSGTIPRYSYSKVSQALASRQLQWKQEDPESGPGTSLEEATPNGPPRIPSITEQDLQQDPVLQQALWSIINNVSSQ